MKQELIRQGDIMLVPVKELPTGGTRSSKRELTIALGEATGHHHTLYPTDKKSKATLVEVNGRRFIDVGAEYFLRHQEHEEHRIVPGLYEIVIEEEYDPFEEEMKKVVD